MELNQQQLISLYRQSFRCIPIAAVILDSQGEILFSNKAFTEMFGYTEQETKGHYLSDLIVPVKFLNEERSLTNLVINKQIIRRSCIRCRKDGEEIVVSIQGYPLKINDEKCFVLGIYQDVAGLSKKNLEKGKGYIRDGLTGLYNRDFMAEEMQRLDSKRYLPITVVIGDVNGLKLTNDVFGHNIGDKFLKKIASLLQENSRKGDLVGRYGGDEFMILLPGTSYHQAEKLIKRVSEIEIKVEGIQFNPAICFGIATKCNEEEDFEIIRERADNSMYEKKLLNRPEFERFILKELLDIQHYDQDHFRKYIKLVITTADKFGRVMKFNDSKIRKIRKLAKYYDIGRINPETAGDIYKIAEVGYNIAKNINELATVAEEILSIREHWDGSGVPRGLKGKEIPLQARMIAIVDYYYQHALADNDQKVIQDLKSLAGIKLDPYLVEIFINNVLSKKN